MSNQVFASGIDARDSSESEFLALYRELAELDPASAARVIEDLKAHAESCAILSLVSRCSLSTNKIH